jgi:glycosyltransferase involved in cell wall biosynthesis
MKIFMNALSVTSGGGLICLRGLLPELERLGSPNRYVILVARSQQNVLSSIPERMKRIILPLNHKNVLLRLLWEQLVVPWILLWYRADWLYAVGNQAPILSPCKVLLLIENANPFSGLDLPWTKMERLRHRVLAMLTRLSARRATVVRFVSRNSCELISIRLGIPKDKTIVIPHGIRQDRSRSERPECPQGLRSPVLLIVSNVGPHKNLGVCIEALDQLVHQRSFTGTMAIVGEILYRDYHLGLMQAIRDRALEGYVQFVGWKDGEQLAAYYEAAAVFVFPSVEETFGLPVFEAMLYGIPVVVPRERGQETMFLPFEEFCGDAVTYFEPFDAGSLARSVEMLLADSSARDRLVEQARLVAGTFRWDRTAAAIASAMERHSGR